jgi:hypothetical protein
MGDPTVFFLRMLAALEKSRQRHAALEIKRHAHLIREAAAYEADRTDDRRTAAELPAGMTLPTTAAPSTAS